MQCPSCGRPIEFEEKYTKLLSCKYCNSILEFWESELSKIWEQSEFIDFPSLFEVGKNIEYKWKNISVKGQVRYEYDWGFFDKFFVTVDGKQMYIREDDGTVIFSEDGIFQDWELTLIDKVPGTTLNLWWKELFIQEVWIFKLISLKWSVMNKLIPWREYEYLDWVYNQKMYFLEKDILWGKLRICKQL
jgi:hypothetical protein